MKYLFAVLVILGNCTLAGDELESKCQLVTFSPIGDITEWRSSCDGNTILLANRKGGIRFSIRETGQQSLSGSQSTTRMEGRLHFSDASSSSRSWELASGETGRLNLEWQSRADARLDLIDGWSTDNNGDGLARYVYGFTKTFGYQDGVLHAKISEISESTDALIIYVRHGVLIIDNIWEAGETLSIEDNRWLASSTNPTRLDGNGLVHGSLQLTFIPALGSLLEKRGLEGLLFSDLWRPLQLLCLGIESLIGSMSEYLGVAFSLLLLAVAIRVITFPLNRWGGVQQSAFTAVQEAMKPRLGEINRTFKGAEKSERTVALYKEFGVSPLSGLKGSVPLLVQLPILIAIFNVTTESALFSGGEFLWIADLSLPDRIVDIKFDLPILGSGINLIPILLGFVGWYSSHSQSGSVSSGLALNIGITTLCYSFAAAAVMYWLIINILQILERRLYASN